MSTNNPYDTPASKISPRRKRGVIKTHTVLCEWRPDDESREQIVVVIRGCTDAQDAVNNACLWLMKDRGNTVEGLLVIEGKQQITAIDNPVFCAEDFDDVITFAGTIVSSQTIR